MKMSVGKLIKQAIKKMPEPVRHACYRKFLNIKYKLPEGVTFEVAETQEDLSAAFRILHDAYVKEGYMDPHALGMRLMVYQALPTTSTLVAKSNGRVVATLTVIRDNPYGLPMEKAFDVSNLRQGNKRLAEVSALAIDKSFPHQKGDVSLPLFKYLYEYATVLFGIDFFVIAVNPKAVDFYKSLFAFDELPQPVIKSYDFVKGAPAVGLCLDLNKAPENWMRMYASCPAERNIATYFLKTQFQQFIFPNRPFFKLNDPVMTPELLDYFFNQQSNIFSQLKAREAQVLRSLYRDPKYLAVLPKPSVGAGFMEQRKDIRFEVKNSAILWPAVSQKHVLHGFVTVIDVARSGLKIFAPQFDLTIGKTFPLTIRVGESTYARIVAQVVYKEHNNYGLVVLKEDIMWRSYIEYLEADQLKSDPLLEAALYSY